jgi:hypothetical protein
MLTASVVLDYETLPPGVDIPVVDDITGEQVVDDITGEIVVND